MAMQSIDLPKISEINALQLWNKVANPLLVRIDFHAEPQNKRELFIKKARNDEQSFLFSRFWACQLQLWLPVLIQVIVCPNIEISIKT